MSDERGGAPSEDERLAPVIPLFGARSGGAPADGRAADGRPTDRPTADEWRSTWADESAAVRRGPGPRHPAAVALASAETPAASSEAPASSARRGLRAIGGHSTGSDETSEDPVVDASEVLVRKLRSKQLSSREAREVLREQGVPADLRDDIVADFERRGYLDDASLAELLVTSGSRRKGQGRVAIARTLNQRGIPREIGDEALAVLDDDDAERALDYARTKVSSLRRYDEVTAVRRLVGQLSRRGYGGSIALTAARTAWRETQRGGGVGRVRFEET